MDRITGSSRGGELLKREVCDAMLLLRTRVGASEKDVYERGNSAGGGTVRGDATRVYCD